MVRTRTRVASVKASGDPELVGEILEYVEDGFNVIRRSGIIPNEKAGVHGFLTIVKEVNEG